MRRGGQAPKPTNLRILHGDRADRFNPAEPIPAAGPMEPPADITDEVRAVWEFTVRHLETMGIAAPSDRDCLRVYCEATVAHAKASQVIGRTAILIKGQMGNMVRNPALQVQRDAALTMLRCAQEFGLTPSARTRIAADRGENGQDSPFAGTG